MKKRKENERITLAAFIDTEKGSPEVVKRTLDEICKITKITNEKKQNDRSKRKTTDPGYQYVILKKLMKEEKIGKNKKGFFVEPEYIGLAYSSMIQSKIRNLEDKGLFKFWQFTVFGFKEEWKRYPERYPEIHFFREAVNDTQEILYRLKHIKAIFLIRDFSKQWNEFLASDIHAAVKHWIWKFITSQLSFTFDVKERHKNEQIEFLRGLGLVKDKNTIKRYRDEIEKGYKKKWGSNKVPLNLNIELGNKTAKKMGEYTTIYSDVVINYIVSSLDKKHQKILADILEWALNTYHREVNSIGFYADVGGLPGYPKTHFRTPSDNEEGFFRRTHDKITLSRLKTIVEDLRLETIDDSLKSLFDSYDKRNYERFSIRLSRVLMKHVSRPNYVIFDIPELEKKRKEVVALAKKEEWVSSPSIKSGKIKSDEDIFSLILLVYKHDMIDTMKELHRNLNLKN